MRRISAFVFIALLGVLPITTRAETSSRRNARIQFASQETADESSSDSPETTTESSEQDEPELAVPEAAAFETQKDSGAVQYECCPERSWFYGDASAFALRRDNDSQLQPVVLLEPGLSTVLSTRSLDFNLEVGLKTRIGTRLNDCTAFELVYFGLHDWDGNAFATGADNLSIPGDLGLATLDFLNADEMRLDYNSRLHNVEANLIRERERLTLLAGFRYVQADEEFNINAFDSDSGRSDYNIRARNRLFGGQLGAIWRREVNCNWTVEAVGQIGLFANSTAQRTFVGDLDNTTILRDHEITGSRTAVLGEGEINLIRRLTDRWSFRGGFNVLTLDGIALAPDQLDFTNTPNSGRSLDASGSVLYYGGSLGLEARF